MPLVNAELSVLVDVLHQPELLFLEGSDARNRCESGGFISKWVLSSLTNCSLINLMRRMDRLLFIKASCTHVTVLVGIVPFKNNTALTFCSNMFYAVFLHDCIYFLSLYSRLIQHTKSLMNSDESLCIKVLKTLQEMLIRNLEFDEKVRCLEMIYVGSQKHLDMSFLCVIKVSNYRQFTASISLNTKTFAFKDLISSQILAGFSIT